jgi:hypothetical protein
MEIDWSLFLEIMVHVESRGITISHRFPMKIDRMLMAKYFRFSMYGNRSIAFPPMKL